jgi:hypothetical protein
MGGRSFGIVLIENMYPPGPGRTRKVRSILVSDAMLHRGTDWL